RKELSGERCFCLCHEIAKQFHGMQRNKATREAATKMKTTRIDCEAIDAGLFFLEGGAGGTFFFWHKRKRFPPRLPSL
ncbi:hypothetical protein, partial [Desulfarculus baarsii]